MSLERQGSTKSRGDSERSDDSNNSFDSPRPRDFFVTSRKVNTMPRDADMDVTAEQLRAELAAKSAEIERLQQRLTVATRNSEGDQRRELARRPDFRELKELVSKFNPKETTCLSAEEWIREIQTTAVHYGWDDATSLHCARLNLEGSAKLWWAGVQHEVTTWELFSAKLIRAYPSARDAIYYHTQMSNRKKVRNETIEEYVYSQVALGRRAGFSEGVIVKYVIAGLGDFVSKSRVQLGGKIDTVEDLITQLKWMEGMINTTAESIGTRVTERKKEKVLACYRCSQPGHKASVCPAVAGRNCYNCGVSGHIAKNCPNPKPPKAGPSRMQVVDEENNFIRIAEVGGKKLNALIDSGCKVSTIQCRFAEQIGSCEVTSTTLVGFGGRKVDVDKIVTTTVKLDDIEVPIKLNVVPNWAQQTALILGRDMLNQNGVMMVNRNGKVEFQRDSVRRAEPDEMVVEVKPRKYETMFTIDTQVKYSPILADDLNVDGPKDEVLKVVNQFQPCFAKKTRDLGVAKKSEMKIILSDAEPVYVKPHRKEYTRETTLRELVEEIIDSGIVTESTFPYSSRVVRDTHEKRDMKARIARWFLKLAEYDCWLEHRSGSMMRHVDVLSRNPVEDGRRVDPALCEKPTIDIANSDFIVALQRQASRSCDIVDVLGRDSSSDEERKIQQNYRRRLIRKVKGERCFVIPNRVRWRLVHTYYDEMGHFGEEKVLERLWQIFWFPIMRKYVRSYIQTCPQCALYKSKGGKPEGYLHPWPKEPIPFGTVHMDHMVPFVRSARGNSYVLLLTCGFSKFVVARAVRSTKTAPVLTFLVEVTSIFGTPSRIITDRGTAFTAKAFQEYCRVNAIEHIKTAVGSPRANGQAERANRTVLNAIRCMVGENNTRWDEQLPKVQWSVNNMPNSSTNMTPSTLVLSYKPRDVHQNAIILTLHDEGNNVLEDFSGTRDQAVRAIERRQRLQKRHFDDRRRKPNTYEVGDMVLVERDLTAMGHSRKLEAKFKGPFMVKTVLGNDRYELEDVPDVHGSNRARTTVYAADRIKRWCQLEDLEESDEESNDGTMLDGINN